MKKTEAEEVRQAARLTFPDVVDARVQIRTEQGPHSYSVWMFNKKLNRHIEIGRKEDWPSLREAWRIACGGQQVQAEPSRRRRLTIGSRVRIMVGKLRGEHGTIVGYQRSEAPWIVRPDAWSDSRAVSCTADEIDLL